MGSTIVITGASSGAGRAAALEFAKYQCHIVIAARKYLRAILCSRKGFFENASWRPGNTCR